LNSNNVSTRGEERLKVVTVVAAGGRVVNYRFSCNNRVTPSVSFFLYSFSYLSPRLVPSGFIGALHRERWRAMNPEARLSGSGFFPLDPNKCSTEPLKGSLYP